MLQPLSVMAVGAVAAIATVGLVGRMIINTVTGNVLRIKAASGAPLQPAQEQRMAQMEAELASLKEEVSRLSAVETFYARLQAPAPANRTTDPPGGR